MRILRNKFAIIGLALIAMTGGWLAYARTMPYRVKTVLIEAEYPRSSGVHPGLGTRLRLLAGMSWPNSRSSEEMETELVGYGDAAVPLLAEAFRAGPDMSGSSSAACDALLRLGEPSVDPITAIMLDCRNAEAIRLRATLTLQNLADKRFRALLASKKLVDGQELEFKATSAVPALVKMMQEEPGNLRFAALRALAIIDPSLAVKEGVAIVREGPLSQKDMDRWYWYTALFLIGPANQETRGLMEKELARGSYVKEYAQWARTHTIGECWP